MLTAPYVGMRPLQLRRLQRDEEDGVGEVGGVWAHSNSRLMLSL